VERRGWGAFVFFVIALLAYAALWLPYALHPESLGTDSASQLGYITIGIAFVCAAVGTFLVMHRKEAQLEHPLQTGEPVIRATFTELLLIGIGTLLCGVSCIWVGQEPGNLGEFSLLAIGLVLVAIATVSLESHLSSRIGRPAAFTAIAGVIVYALHCCLQALPTWLDPDWRVSIRITGVAFALGGLSCVLAAVHRQKEPKAVAR
jgi:peptidoglycan/LPS O-acetylase OafA/YrhL